MPARALTDGRLQLGLRPESKVEQKRITVARVEDCSGNKPTRLHHNAGMAVSLALPVLFMLVSGQSQADTLLNRAEYFLLNRHLSHSYLDSCGRALESSRPALKNTEPFRELRVRYCIQRGDDTVGNGPKMYWYRQAQAEARELLSQNPRSAVGHLWYGTVLVRYSQVQGIAASASQLPEVRRQFETALRCDSGYAMAWYALGRFFHEVPRFVGGSLPRAESCYVRGLKCDPHLTLLRASYAQLLAETRRKGAALVHARAVLSETSPTNPGEHRLYDIPRTQALIRQLGGRR